MWITLTIKLNFSFEVNLDHALSVLPYVKSFSLFPRKRWLSWLIAQKLFYYEKWRNWLNLPMHIFVHLYKKTEIIYACTYMYAHITHYKFFFFCFLQTISSTSSHFSSSSFNCSLVHKTENWLTFCQCLSRALRDDNPKFLMAASAFLLPVQPLMVSAVHTGMMEVIHRFWSLTLFLNTIYTLKFGTTSKSVLWLWKLVCYTLEYYNNVNMPIPLTSIRIF